MTQPITIDCQYIQPQLAAAYLLIHNGRAVFIENNTQYAVPIMMDVLREVGVSPENVDYAIVTHVHLDHAGGSSALMEACPNAQMLCHPRGHRHLVDPSRLIVGTEQVYGKERFERLYGKIGGVAEDRVRSVTDGEEINWNGRMLRFLHTPGHASHHMSIIDEESSSIFTGDSFGVCYPALQRKGTVAFISSPPTDFDVDLSRTSIEKTMAAGCEHVYPTHFGEIQDVKGACDQLYEGLDFSAKVIDEVVQALRSGEDSAQVEKMCTERVFQYAREQVKKVDMQLSDDDWQLLDLDFELSAAGLFFSASRKAKKH